MEHLQLFLQLATAIVHRYSTTLSTFSSYTMKSTFSSLEVVSYSCVLSRIIVIMIIMIIITIRAYEDLTTPQVLSYT